MALLNEIATSGFTGLAPTPVETVALNQYFVEHELFAMLPFVDIGLGSNIGNLQCTVVTYDAPAEAEFRKIGEEYTVNNNEPKYITLTMKPLGQEFQSDRALARAFANNAPGLDKWTGDQIGQVVNAIINGFCKYFIQGNSTTDPKQFDGLQVFFDKHAGQVMEEVLTLEGGLNANNALAAENYLYEILARVPGANCIITTRLKGKPFLQAVESNRGRGHSKLTVADKQYNEAVGLPVIGLEDKYFPEALTTKGIPFIPCKFAENGGIRVAVPMGTGVANETAVLDIVRPSISKNEAGEAVFTRKGGVELLSVPIIEDAFCAAIGHIKITNAAG